MVGKLLLRAAESPRLMQLIVWASRRSGLTERFIAGEDWEETVSVVRDLSKENLKTTLDLLGEGVEEAPAAEKACHSYLQLLEDIEAHGLSSSISIKLTQLGLEIDEALCRSHLHRIVDRARRLENFVRIDMEQSTYTKATLRLFEECLETFGARHVGIVIQAYLYRSRQDVERLAPKGCRIRLCKGAYREPAEVAYPSKKDVDENFKALTTYLLESPSRVAIATHDERMLEHAFEQISKGAVHDSGYEFQMLYGVRRERQLELVACGYPVRVYVPFGTEWAPYFLRRLAERPANLLFLLRNFFKK